MNSLRDTRRRLGLTQEDLGKKTGIHREWISVVERGLSKPTQRTKAGIEAVTGPIDWLETASAISTKNPNYYQAERLVERLIAITATMDGSERTAIKKLITKYF